MDKRRRLTKGEAKQPSKKVSWSDFPSEVLENILSRLPARYLMRFRCVCKYWCNLIAEPHFIKLQLNRSALTKEGSRLVFASFDELYSIDVEAYRKNYIETPTQKRKIDIQKKRIDLLLRDHCDKFFTVSGSCNGLLFLIARDSLYLLNPLTKENKELPYPEILARRTQYHRIDFGFGYSPRTNEYKVVVIRYYMIEQSAPSEVCVYTLGTNSSWRSIRSTMYRIKGCHHALVNGAPHWIADGMPGFSMVAISFDMADENFRELSLPKSISQEYTNNCPIGLVGLGGSLSLYHYCKADGNFYIWVMKDYGDEQSWTKQFSIAVRILPGLWSVVPLCILKKDEVILFEGPGLFVVDVVKNETFRLGRIRDRLAPYGGSEMYLESLVSLRTDDSVDGSTKQLDREREQKSKVVSL